MRAVRDDTNLKTVADPSRRPSTARPGARGGRRTPVKIDRYELHELIGYGGMGAVYRAFDTKLKRFVALKTAAGHRTGARLTDRVRQRFLREALALSKVEHRNVVLVLDFGFADDGTPFLVMEQLRGQDLGARLAKADGPLAVTEIVDIMLGVCAALRACHRVGIIHRDLKPGNIFLAETEMGREVKVLDFGVSKTPATDALTREGQIVGTPQYLAPEQIDGKVGPASDQYALGVLLYVCLTLRLPYADHQNRGLLRAIGAGRFEAPHTFRPDLPDELEAIVLRAMHLVPRERFASVYTLGQHLWPLASPPAQEEWRSYYRPGGDRGPTAAHALARTEIVESAEAEGDQALSARTTVDRLPPFAAGMNDLPTAGAVRDWSLSAERLSPHRSPHRRTRLVWVVGAASALAAGFALQARAGRSATSAIAPRAPASPPLLAAPPAAPRRLVSIVPILPSPSPPPPPSRSPPPPAPPAPPPAPIGAPPHAPHRRHPRVQAQRATNTATPEAPFDPALPNIDRSGIGIPTD